MVMKNFSVLVILGLTVLFSIDAFAQSDSGKNELNPSDTDLIILFSVAILLVLGVVIYITRELILRKKTTYDKGKFTSKKNRDYEKYHADWGDEENVFDSRKSKKIDDEFRKELEESDVPDYYQIFGVSADASQEEIKNRYRKLAKELHPDKSKDSKSEEKMAQINKAYEVLSDLQRREQYDKYMSSL
jgi:molecular chaperone DnaJ